MRVGLIAFLITGLSTLCFGQTTQPSPTTKPARTQPAASTPKEALRSLNLALRDGDISAIQSLFLTRDEPEAHLIAAMADYANALVALHDAARSIYGKDGANHVTGDLAAQSAEGLAAIDKAEIKVEGDAANVKFAGATDPPVTLVKVDGRWRVPLAQLLDGADKTTEDRRFKELQNQANQARKTAEEITAGKYNEGAAKASEVWRSRLLEPATTRPTTRATEPQAR